MTLHSIAAYANVSLGLLTACLFLVACGGKSETTESSDKRPPNARNEETIPESKANRMEIPFEIAIQAALNGHEDTVMQALETGTDPNQVDENGRTLLMVASFNGHTNTVKKLIEAGANIDTQDMAGRTALMYAATGRNVPTVKLLLENKAKVNLVDSGEHWSALMFAAAEGNMEVVDLLLEHKADTSLTDVDESTAESFARDNGHNVVAERIKNWKQP